MNEKQDAISFTLLLSYNKISVLRSTKKHFFIKGFTSSTVLKLVMGIRLFQENGFLSISPEDLIQ